MRTAIVYYSLTGNVDNAAEKIAARLGADIIRIAPEKEFPDKGFKKFFWGGKSAVMREEPKLLPCSFDAANYDRVILGTPVWASNITPPMRTFVKAHAEELKEKSLAVFFCFSGGGADKACEKLKKLIGVENFAAETALIDPLAKPSEANEKLIAEFCEKLS
ncbi:MAG: flavodoxin [Clostridiales bacterium]|nr:flavodoxin [Clostridiales bacterium]